MKVKTQSGFEYEVADKDVVFLYGVKEAIRIVREYTCQGVKCYVGRYVSCGIGINFTDKEIKNRGGIKCQ